MAGSNQVAKAHQPPYVRARRLQKRRTYSIRASHVLRTCGAPTPYVRRTWLHTCAHVGSLCAHVRLAGALPPSHVRLDSVRSSAMGAPLDLPGRPGTFLQSIEEYADSIHGRATAIAPIILTAPAGRVLETSDIPERRCRMVHGAIRLSRARVPPYCALIWRPFPSA